LVKKRQFLYPLFNLHDPVVPLRIFPKKLIQTAGVPELLGGTEILPKSSGLFQIATRSPASAGIANRPLVFLGIFFNFRQIVYLLAKGRSSASRCLVMGVATRRYKNLRIVIVIIIIMLGSPLLTDSP